MSMLTPRFVTCILVAALVALAACVSGCTSLYRQTMREMAQPGERVLADRAQELNEHFIAANDAFARSFAQLELLETNVHTDDIDAARLELSRQINLAALHAWNLRRSIISLHAAADQAIAELDEKSDETHRRNVQTLYRSALAQATRAEREMPQMIDGLRHQAALLGSNTQQGEVRSLMPIVIPYHNAPQLMAHLEEAIYSTKALADICH